ncbi:CEI_1a_G0013580.mRNA.1.CDS.1 [Saccharomyces cerevisiae]|nr:AMH_1a_G0013630.mRNA.1.CDS.1 [Saccharomyces cerevisiae]CAI4386046.1 CEI_1a_G0013580.mRNA.1.CDS.1 [Saccharomyces cerevisiae]CAI6592524.1 AMH_1a_G0013630.mRNA.1.CDS.1 [Saccharomyces cerevisiae]CAI7231097.1 CEI_1a_G0013580.mRNA.1.CDS.1 [Saccharomyces cerevisiae]
MEMSLFLNESYIFHRLRMWSTVFWGLCVFVCAECGNANYRGAFEEPFYVPVIFLFQGPSFGSYCLSLYWYALNDCRGIMLQFPFPS